MTIQEKPLDPRTEETRRKLIEVGIRLFGQNGYDAVSTRAITREAGANLSAITYHFGGKEGFYEACLHTILDDMSEIHRPVVALISDMIETADKDKTALSTVVAHLADQMIRALLTNSNFDAQRAFLLREHATPSRFYGQFIDRLPNFMLAFAEQFVAVATGMQTGQPETRIRAFAFFSQILSLIIARQVLKHQLGIEEYDDKSLRMIVEQIATSMAFSIELPAPDFTSFTPVDLSIEV